MPRTNFVITPLTTIDVVSLNRLVTELNTALATLQLELSRSEGKDGFAPSISSNLNMNGKQITNVGASASLTGVPNRQELIDNALYATDGLHTAVAPIDAPYGVQTPTATADNQAVNLGQIKDELSSTAVLLTGDQTIAGNKTFTEGVRIDGKFGFHVAPVDVQVVSGSRGGNVALASLLSALVNFGLITDSTGP